MKIRIALVVLAATATFVVLLYQNPGLVHWAATSNGPLKLISREDPNWLIPTVGAGVVLVVGVALLRRRRV